MYAFFTYNLVIKNDWRINMNKRNYKGITLIALVITIIVLLILAGKGQFLCQGAGSVTADVRGFPLLAGIPRPVPGRLQRLTAREMAWIELTPILPGRI